VDVRWEIEVVDGHPQDRRFDIDFWQRAGAVARWEAAWQLVIDAHALKNRDPDELRLRRSAISTRPSSR